MSKSQEMTQLVRCYGNYLTICSEGKHRRSKEHRSDIGIASATRDWGRFVKEKNTNTCDITQSNMKDEDWCTNKRNEERIHLSRPAMRNEVTVDLTKARTKKRVNSQFSISWREQPVRDWQETIIYWDWELLTAWGRREEGGGFRGFCLCHDKIYLNPPATVRFRDILTTLSPLSPPPSHH